MEQAALRLRRLAERDLETVDACAVRAFDALYTPQGHQATDRSPAPPWYLPNGAWL